MPQQIPRLLCVSVWWKVYAAIERSNVWAGAQQSINQELESSPHCGVLWH